MARSDLRGLHRGRGPEGIPRNHDYNGTMQAGVSYVQRIIQNGMRKSAPAAICIRR